MSNTPRAEKDDRQTPPGKSESTDCFRALVSGRVQGVGFRWYVIQQARALNLSGWVRNLGSGNVEVLAEGRRSELETLISRLWRGPSYSAVQNVDVHWEPPVGLRGFDVAY